MNYDESETGGIMLRGIRGIIQAACVLAIAIGAGLFAFGNYLRPDFNPTNPAEFMQSFDQHDQTRLMASTASGVGVGFMTLGALGLTVPWLNVLLNRQRDPSEPERGAGQAGAAV